MAVTWDLKLDNVSIKNWVTSMSITMSEDQVHNDITLEIASPQHLWWSCDPVNALYGSARLWLTLDGVNHYFLLEKRSVTDGQGTFSVWGRSLSAMDDEPYAEKMDYSMDEPKLASVIANEMCGRTVIWQAVDWLVPKKFTCQDVPIKGVLSLAEQIGAVVRGTPGGDIVVRPRFAQRPINMQKSSATVEYDYYYSLLELSCDQEIGTKFNCIQVAGYGPDLSSPQTEVEDAPDGTRNIGDETFIRVYWAGKKPSVLPDAYATDGQVYCLGDVEDTIKSEMVEFHDGVANTQRPITRLRNVTWIGAAAGYPEFTKWTTELVLPSYDPEDIASSYRIARVDYDTTFSRYRVVNHNVERLLLVLAIHPEQSDIAVKVSWGAGDKEAPPIDAEWLTTIDAAKTRATVELDQSSYNRLRCRLKAPFNKSAVDGILVNIGDGALSVQGVVHCSSSTIVFDGPAITNELEVVRFLI